MLDATARNQCRQARRSVGRSLSCARYSGLIPKRSRARNRLAPRYPYPRWRTRTCQEPLSQAFAPGVEGLQDDFCRRPGEEIAPEVRMSFGAQLAVVVDRAAGTPRPTAARCSIHHRLVGTRRQVDDRQPSVPVKASGPSANVPAWSGPRRASVSDMRSMAAKVGRPAIESQFTADAAWRAPMTLSVALIGTTVRPCPAAGLAAQCFLGAVDRGDAEPGDSSPVNSNLHSLPFRDAWPGGVFGGVRVGLARPVRRSGPG